MGVELFLQLGEVAIALPKGGTEEFGCLVDGSVETRAFIAKDFSGGSLF